MRPKTLQNYVNKLFNRGEINEERKKLMRPNVAQIELTDYVKPTSNFNNFLNFDQSLTL